MKIVYQDINAIKPYRNNPRNNRKTINKLKELISSAEVEFNVPLVVDKEGVIVKGHSRYYALKELDYKLVPVIVSEKSDEINNEDRIQDNIVQELSTWRNEELSIELRESGINPSEYNLTFRDLGYKVETPKDIEEADVTKARDLFLGKGQPSKEYVELVCPHCGEEFMLLREDLKKI